MAAAKHRHALRAVAASRSPEGDTLGGRLGDRAGVGTDGGDQNLLRCSRQRTDSRTLVFPGLLPSWRRTHPMYHYLHWPQDSRGEPGPWDALARDRLSGWGGIRRALGCPLDPESTALAVRAGECGGALNGIHQFGLSNGRPLALWRTVTRESFLAIGQIPLVRRIQGRLRKIGTSHKPAAIVLLGCYSDEKHSNPLTGIRSPSSDRSRVRAISRWPVSSSPPRWREVKQYFVVQSWRRIDR